MPSYLEVRCKSFLNRIAESPFTIRDYSIRLSGNPYNGCLHDCAWCYAAYIHRFNTRYDKTVSPKDFGNKIFAKINAPEVLRRELDRDFRDRGKLQREFCEFSTITDSYQPCERKYRLTRQCLEVFMEFGFPVTALTRSHLVLDDLHIWKQLADNGLGVVGLSITRPATLDPHVKKLLEPKSPRTELLLDTLRTLNLEGIPTFVFINPIVPLLIDSEECINQLLNEVSETGNPRILFGVMRLNSLTWGLFRDRLSEYDQDLIPQYEQLYFEEGEKVLNRAWQLSFNYRRRLYGMARDICKRVGLGFSCEGGLYDLWTEDWADVQNPYRYPTGYNLWQAIRIRDGEPLLLPQLASYSN